MGKFITRRLLQMIPVLIGTTLLLYFLAFAMPGDPTAGLCGDRQCPAQYVAQFRAEYHLDDPFFMQYLNYLNNLVHGNFGVLLNGHTVVQELAVRYPNTVKLAVIAVIFEAVVGMAAGILAGIRKGGFIDTLVTLFTLLLLSIPVFVIGSLAQLVFGIKLGWFPVTAGDGGLYSLLMPGLVLGALSLAYSTRLTRTSLVENLRADYVRTAKAKGLSNARAIGIHALRNSLLPVITYIGASFGGLMGGAIVTERLFNIQGIGLLIWNGILQKQRVAIVGPVTVLVLVFLLANLIVDVLYAVLDPRISHD
ncbi:MAG: ABC transporter permease [Propionibacteriaceae bacterium]|nr:ABC transporter permease [Propionibacteriaceae bacterium]